jgi:hypothetical protein
MDSSCHSFVLLSLAQELLRPGDYALDGHLDGYPDFITGNVP